MTPKKYLKKKLFYMFVENPIGSLRFVVDSEPLK